MLHQSWSRKYLKYFIFVIYNTDYGQEKNTEN